MKATFDSTNSIKLQTTSWKAGELESLPEDEGTVHSVPGC